MLWKICRVDDYLFSFSLQLHSVVVCMSVVDGFLTPPSSLHSSPFLFLFNVTGLAHMTLSVSVGTARVRAVLPAGALELDLQDKKKKKQPSRTLIDISDLSSPFLLTSFIQCKRVPTGGRGFIRMLYLHLSIRPKQKQNLTCLTGLPDSLFHYCFYCHHLHCV